MRYSAGELLESASGINFIGRKYVHVKGIIDLGVQIDPMILLDDLVRLNLNQPFRCSRDPSELKINIRCNIYIHTLLIPNL